jgi:hypothetical protein
MRYFAFFILCIILYSCKKEDEYKPYNITISGVVTDQATGQPVEGATVSLGLQMSKGSFEGLFGTMQSTSTGPDGSYRLITSTERYGGPQSPGSRQRTTFALIAGKSGYIGSNRQEMYYYGAHNSVLDLQLYRSSELDLRIKNDTTNAIDAVNIKLVKMVFDSYWTVLTLDCNKRKLDSTYVVKNLFGNWEYNILVLKPGGQTFSPEIKYSITPKPDEINNFDISF